jgi:hypothetical protein
MKLYRAALVVLSVVLLAIASSSLFANEEKAAATAQPAENANAAVLTSARKTLGTDARWTRIYTYDDDVQTTVGNRVKSGKVISRVSTAAIDPMSYLLFEPSDFNGSGVLWIDGKGSSHLCEPGRKPDDVKPTSAVQSLLERNYAVLSVDLPASPSFRAGEPRAEDTLLAVRVRAILAAVASALPLAYQLDVVGTGDAGPAVLLASTFLNDLKPDDRKKIRFVMADLRGMNLGSTTKKANAFFLPGASEFGGIPGIAALNATQKLTVAGTMETPAAELQSLEKAFADAGDAAKLTLIKEALSDELLVQLLTAKAKK